MRIKILQLNAWNGRIKGALARYLECHDFDIICLQEAVWSAVDKGISKDELMDAELVERQLSFFVDTVDQLKTASRLEYDYRTSNWGLALNFPGGRMEQGCAILSRWPFVSQEMEYVHGKYCDNILLNDNVVEGYPEVVAVEDQGFAAQRVVVRVNKTKQTEGESMTKGYKELAIVNYHGYWLPDPLGDDNTVAAMMKVAKLCQKDSAAGNDASGAIADRILKGSLATIMCGDLNIVSDAPAMRELDFLRDLTAENSVENTLVGLKFAGKVACDHILVNDNIEVKNFGVDQSRVISDHWPLVAEIDL